MLSLDISAIILITTNVVQMVFILFLLVPIVDIITLSRHIKHYTDLFADSTLLRTLAALYGIVIAGYGILGPTRTLNKLKIPRTLRVNETSPEKLMRIIDSTNATRNYLLAGFSLFFLLVIWRLFEYIIFSAKLHEFSNLMGNYDLIDITFNAELEQESEPTFIIDDSIEDVHWPSVVDLNKSEHRRIKTFFRDTQRKSDGEFFESKESQQQKAAESADKGTNSRTVKGVEEGSATEEEVEIKEVSPKKEDPKESNKDPKEAKKDD